MHSSEYTCLRERFVQLCLTDLPDRLHADRAKNAPGEFDMFCSDWRVRDVAIKETVFYFTTRRLAMAVANDKMRWVGEFLCGINVKTKEITCEGNEPQLNSDENPIFHPHVYSSRVPCFGQSSAMKFSDWFGDGRIAHIGLYVVNFLCMARGSSHYLDPTKWPALTPEEAVAWHQQR